MIFMNRRRNWKVFAQPQWSGQFSHTEIFFIDGFLLVPNTDCLIVFETSSKCVSQCLMPIMGVFMSNISLSVTQQVIIFSRDRSNLIKYNSTIFLSSDLSNASFLLSEWKGSFSWVFFSLPDQNWLEETCGVVANVQHCNIVVSNLELQ